MRKTRPLLGWMSMVVGLTVTSSPLHGQRPQASATALALGHTVTATARGFSAVANNPAGLGAWDSPGFSLAVPALAFGRGVGPVGLQDLVDWEGRLLPSEVKAEWLQRVGEAGAQSGMVELGLTPLALSVGPVGFQLSAVAAGSLSLGPDAAELLLYGNAGRTGEPRDFDLEGSEIQGFALTSAAVSYGRRVHERLHLGITGTYTVGHGLVTGSDAGSTLASDPVAVDLSFPVISNRSGNGGVNIGSGFGVDLGALWVEDDVQVGATIQNVLNSFEWSLDDLSYVPGTALFDVDSSVEDFEERPARDAPASVRERVGELTPKPAVAVGASYSGFESWSLQADIRTRASGGLEVGPAFRAGIGVEYRGLPVLPLRAHGAVVSSGVQVGGGASLIAGPVHLSVAGAMRRGDLEDATLVMISLSIGAN